MVDDKINNAILCVKLMSYYDGKVAEGIDLVSKILNLTNKQKQRIIRHFEGELP